MRTFRILWTLAALFAIMTRALALATPAAPTVTIVGTPGTGQACYWVIAADEKPTGSRRTAGNLTLPSAPTLVRNLPEPLNADNHAVIRITPVEGAAKYYVLKTLPWREPAPVTVTVAHPGEKTYYYWISVCNGFRQSGLYGPYPAKACGDPAGNAIAWTSVPGAAWYNIFRTETPEPPVGRTHCVVAVLQGRNKPAVTSVTDSGPARFGVAGYPATPLTAPVLGEGMLLLAETTGGEIRDTGGSLRPFVVPNVNETVATPLTMVGDGNTSNLRDFNQAQLISTVNVPHLKEPTFMAIMRAFDLRQNADAGGHNDYHGYPGIGGWKSTFEALSVQQTLQTASQGFSVAGYQNNYGIGDTIWLFASTTVEGANMDKGDEGVFTVRGRVARAMTLLTSTLRVEAPRGGILLPLTRTPGQAGTKRLVVNLTQAYTAGRIRRVGNVDVYGTGTAWTRDMVGRWISFDVDTEKGHRLWYQIVDVTSPTEMTILARTLWSEACNLGYSRFIYDPAEMKGPAPYFTHDRALQVLPKDREEAAKAGGYQICPGTLLGSPWRTGNDLNVEPLREAWHKGDAICIAVGPQARLYAGNLKVYGTFTPQDDVGGLEIENWGNRTANAPGLQIGTNGMSNFQTGMIVCLPNNGAGTGVQVLAADGWDERGLATGNVGGRAAFIAPMNLPALYGERGWFPYLYFNGTTLGQGTLQVRNKQQAVVMDISHDKVSFASDVALQGALNGSPRTRGKAVFSGDGMRCSFTIRFDPAYAEEPFVTVSTNQFAAHRLAEVAPDHVTVEFKDAPGVGTGNVVIYWAVQL
jgi:hypothetical protein